MASSSTPNRRKASGATTGTTMDIDESRLKGKRKRVGGAQKREKVKGRFKMSSKSDVIGTGTLSQKQINRTINRYKRALQACYENELKKDGSLQGAKVQFTIPPSGRASRVNVIKNTIGSRAVAKCISTQIKRWRFAKPKEVRSPWPILSYLPCKLVEKYRRICDLKSFRCIDVETLN